MRAADMIFCQQWWIVGCTLRGPKKPQIHRRHDDYKLATSGVANSKEDEVSLHWKYDVTMAQLFNANSLPDGDVVRMVEEQVSCIPSDMVEVRIELVNPITWWKAYRLHSYSNVGYYRVIVEIQDNQPPVWGRFRLVDLFTNHVVLWKAKSFGAETAMYRIADAAEFKGGYRYTLYWIKD